MADPFPVDPVGMSETVLVGDIGGTNSRLQLYEVPADAFLVKGEKAPGRLMHEAQFLNGEFTSFYKIVGKFLEQANDTTVTKFLDTTVTKFLEDNDISVTKFLGDTTVSKFLDASNDTTVTKFLGDTTAEYRWFAVAYLICCFFLIPLIFMGISIGSYAACIAIAGPVVGDTCAMTNRAWPDICAREIEAAQAELSSLQARRFRWRCRQRRARRS